MVDNSLNDMITYRAPYYHIFVHELIKNIYVKN